MALLTVDEALRRILDGAAPLGSESVDLIGAADRVLAEDLAATLTQPPFDASAMDGYAVRAADVASVPAALTVIGESNAGGPFAGTVGPGEAARIFTGAAVPKGADCVVIQEDTERSGDTLTVREAASARRQHPPGGRRLPSGRHAAARRPPARRLGHYPRRRRRPRQLAGSPRAAHRHPGDGR